MTAGVIASAVGAVTAWWRTAPSSRAHESDSAWRETWADSVPAMLWAADAERRCTYVNRSWLAFTGRALVDELGDGWSTIIHLDDRPGVFEIYHAAFESRRAFHLTMRMRGADGADHWILAEGMPRFAEGGVFVGYVGSCIDVSEQKRAESTALAWKNRYEAAILASGQILYDWDPVTDDLAYGGTVAATLGYEPGELSGGFAGWCALVHPDDHAAFCEAAERQVTMGSAFHMEYRVRHRNGSFVMVRDDGYPILDDTGRVRRIVGFVADITEEQRSEAERTNFFDLSVDLLCIAGTDGYARALSPACERILGFTREELLAVPFLHYMHPDDRERSLDQMRRLVTGEQLRSFENRYRCKDGSYKWLQWNARVVAATGLVYMVARDVTLQKEVEATMQHAQQAAESANRAKSEFLATMSHEIRTPLGTILGYADLLTDPTATPEDHREGIATIRRQGAHLLQIVNDILDLAKIEEDRMTVERIPCSPLALATEVVNLMQPLASAKGLAVAFQCGSSVPATISSDPTRLRQILLNLLGNAVKFTPTGSVTLLVEERAPADDAHPILQFTITDTGIGLTADAEAHLFEPFRQGDTSMARTHGGTGLGLAISQRLAGMLGGQIHAENVPSGGSRFVLTLGDGFLEPPAGSGGNGTTAPAPATDRLRLTGRILVAEDAVDNQRLLALHLVRAGADVLVASDGVEACRLVASAHADGAPIDVILMDLQMPHLDGYEATAALRRSGHTAPIIALTAHAMPGERERCLAAGCDDFAAKPIEHHALLQLAQHWLAQRDRRDRDDVAAAGRH